MDEYLKQLEEGKDERPDQVREGLEIYIDLWRRAIAKGVVSEVESVEDAVGKIEARGGLYKVAED